MYHGKNWGGFCDDDAFARVYNNLLLHEYIYFFTPVHFQLAVCPFFYINLPIVVARQQCITRDAFLGELITQYLYVYD